MSRNRVSESIYDSESAFCTSVLNPFLDIIYPRWKSASFLFAENTLGLESISTLFICLTWPTVSPRIPDKNDSHIMVFEQFWFYIFVICLIMTKIQEWFSNSCSFTDWTRASSNEIIRFENFVLSNNLVSFIYNFNIYLAPYFGNHGGFRLRSCTLQGAIFFFRSVVFFKVFSRNRHFFL